MDVNGGRFVLLAGADGGPGGLAVSGGEGLAWHEQDCLALAPDQAPRWPLTAVAGTAIPWVRDRHGQHLRIAGLGDGPVAPPMPAPTAVHAGITLLHDAGGVWLPLELVEGGERRALRPPRGVFIDLGIGGPPGEERLAALYRDGAVHGVVLFHLRTRWMAVVPLPAVAERVAVDEQARTWVAGAGGLCRIAGEPLPAPYRPGLGRFEPQRIVPDAPAVDWPPLAEGGALVPVGIPGLGDGVRGLAVRDGRVFLLGGAAAAPVLFLRRADDEPVTPWTTLPLTLPDLPVPLSDLAVLRHDRIAVLAAFDAVTDPRWLRRDCPVLDLVKDQTGAEVARACLLRHPLRERPEARFVAGADGVVRWVASDEVRSLAPLEVARFATTGAGVFATLDSGLAGCVWDRVVLEARIPSATGLRLEARTSDDPAVFVAIDQAKATALAQARLSGDAEEVLRLERLGWEMQPLPSWSPLPSELPWAEGAVSSRPGEAGCFELLLQAESGANRRLAGRFLQVRLRCTGDGRSTPALRRIRVHYPRFSWQEHYLPRHFRQQERTGGGGRANGADARERLLAVAEGLFTPLEDRVASAELLADPASCPEALLPRLAGILGFVLDESLPLAERRRQVAGLGEVARWRGTLRGVALAIDLAADNAVRRGQVVILENHRLRRTMATLLGVRIDDATNPLTLGTMRSGNSIVGDSLILSAESARAVLAAIDPSLAEADDPTAAQAFFDRYAHQVTVLLHGPARVLHDRIERTLAREMPAHVQWRIALTEHSFVLGLSPLLAVDTALEREPPPAPVVLDRTRLTREGLLTGAAAFSPRHVDPRHTVNH